MLLLPVFALVPAALLRAHRRAAARPSRRVHQPLQGLLVRRDD
jgi:hypothetical protein